MKDLIETTRKLTDVNERFARLPSNSVDILARISREVKELESWIAAGNDYNTKMRGSLKGVITKLDRLDKSAKTFMSKEDVPPDYIIEETGDKEEYEKFFQKALKKFGADSPDDLDKEKKKEFFDYVDKNWDADKESD